MNNLKESLVFAQTAAFTSKERKNAACLRAKSGKARYILPVLSAKVGGL
jgi:hypothetical protein